MKRLAEFLVLLWICEFCDHANRVQLRERLNGDFPGPEEYENHKPWSCVYCGSHEHFKLRETRKIERLIEANGSE